jgi:DNA-damage-inducible protein D
MTEQSTFDSLKHIENEMEYWYARELQPVLEYKKWDNFSKVIKTAMIACKISEHEVSEHFVEIKKEIELAKSAKREIVDYKLSRYACYLIVMNGDPRKKVIAEGQTYFAVKTRQQEFQELYEKLGEDEKRLFIRGDIKQKNMLLAESARNAGVITPLEFAIFQDSGYKGLYNGLTAKDIANKKNISENEDILDYMGSEELAANLFRITQTEAKLKKDKISNKQDANKVHYQVGKTVRKAIEEIGGTMPEELPTAEKSIGQLESEKKKQIKNSKKED